MSGDLQALSSIKRQKPFFYPWIGRRYQADGFLGLRILVLGESHYGQPEEETGEFTKAWVDSYASGKKSNRFFTVVTKLLLQAPTGVRLSMDQKRQLWDRITFYNYVQSFPAASARIRPTQKLWQAAESPFLYVQDCLKPQVILILGRDLSKRAARLVSPSIVACTVPHPASFGFKQAEWSAQIHSCLNSVPRPDVFDGL